MLHVVLSYIGWKAMCCDSIGQSELVKLFDVLSAYHVKSSQLQLHAPPIRFPLRISTSSFSHFVLLTTSLGSSTSLLSLSLSLSFSFFLPTPLDFKTPYQPSSLLHYHVCVSYLMTSLVSDSARRARASGLLVSCLAIIWSYRGWEDREVEGRREQRGGK